MTLYTLLPQPRSVFFNANGAPLAGGYVYTYAPGGGTTPKATYQDPAGVTTNANPVPLDSAGSCLLYGFGSYQLNVTDSLGNPIAGYTGVTADTANIVGVTNASNAAAGYVGEYISQNVPLGSAAAMTSGVTNTVALINLTAGDWDVSGNVVTAPAGSTVTTAFACGISTTVSALPTLPGSGGYSQIAPTSTAGAVNVLPVGPVRINIAAQTAVCLVADIGFTTSTMSAYGFIGARRIR